MIPLSLLDLSVVTTETRPAAALRNSIDLARHVDALGYVRYWLAQPHNPPSRARRDDWADRRGDAPYPRRIGWGDAAQPRAAGGGRTVQDAGSVVSRPD